MFTTVRYFIKTSLVFLVIGILTGLHMSFAKYISQTGYSQELISAHTHLILVGSVMMMIMGVALWFFPRPEKEDKKYNPDLILITYWLMTIATALRFVFQVLASFNSIKLGKHSNCNILIVTSFGNDFIFLFDVGENKSSW